MTKDDAGGKDPERRKHYRPLARLAVVILSRHGEPLPADARVETADLALGGVRCSCSVPMKTGTRLRLRLTLEGGDFQQPATIEAEIKVLRCSERASEPVTRRYEVAMEFTHIPPSDRKTLQRFVNSL